MGQNNIIELNGKQYDAITGVVIGESRIKATPQSSHHTRHQGRAIDGFIRKSTAGSQAPQVVKPAPVTVAHPVHAPASPKKQDISRVGAHNAKAHQPERPKTLMRSTVAKPKLDMKPAIKTSLPSEMMAKPASEIAKQQLEKKVSVTQVNPLRLARANHVAKSHHIRKFERPRHEQVSPVAVAAHSRPQPAVKATRPMGQDFRQASSARPIASRSVALEQAAQRMATKQSAANLFEEALIHATSHEEPVHKASGKRATNRRRLVSITAGIAAFLVIGGFITYLNMPGIELRVASIHAGFHAEMPSYRPTGFALVGGVKASDGVVQLTYQSGSSAYRITQIESDWNSATLLDQNTEQRGAPKQTVQSEGRIIYLYDGSASWVDGGVRYEVTGNANLTADDLVSLATSM